MKLLLLLLFFFICIFFLLKIKEEFRNFKNIFTTNIFENKTIFLIANNSKLSKKTQKFLNNYDYKDSLIVRFNGYKPIIKDYCKGKTDIMVYRETMGIKKKKQNRRISWIF
jgi:hypothetical protein